jgi:hypothetical protein
MMTGRPQWRNEVGRPSKLRPDLPTYTKEFHLTFTDDVWVEVAQKLAKYESSVVRKVFFSNMANEDT